MSSTLESVIDIVEASSTANSFTLTYTTLAFLVASIVLYIFYYSKLR